MLTMINIETLRTSSIRLLVQGKAAYIYLQPKHDYQCILQISIALGRWAVQFQAEDNLCVGRLRP